MAEFNGPATAIPIGQLANHVMECKECQRTVATFAVWVICTSKCRARDLREAEESLCPDGRRLVLEQRQQWAALDAKDRPILTKV